MHNFEVSRFKASAYTVVSSLTITILFIFSSSASISSQPENDSRSVGFDNKCADYHAGSPSDAGIVVGGHPSGLSIDPTNGKIYVVDSITKKISVIDGLTDTLTKTIPIPNIKPVSGEFENRSELAISEFPGYIAINPVTNLLNVAISYSNFLYIFDAESGNLLANVTLTDRPGGISASNFATQVITSHPAPSQHNPYRFSSTINVINNFAGAIDLTSPVYDEFNAIDVIDNPIYKAGSNRSTFVTGSRSDSLYAYDEFLESTYNYTIPGQLVDGLEDVAINPSTKMASIIHRFSNITVLNLTSGTIMASIDPYPHDLAVGKAIAVNQNTNITYALANQRASAKILALDGEDEHCILTDIPVNRLPMDLAIDSERNMIYVTNGVSGIVWAINGATNNLSTVLRFNISPPNSGYIQCNEIRLQQNFSRYDVGTNLTCEAIPYNGYAFSSWSGDYVPSTFSKDPNVNSKASIDLKVSKYGSLNANFITSNPLIPEQFWAPLYGIIPAVIASTFIPSIIQRNKERKISKRHLEYYKGLIGKLDHSELEKEITQLYREGKINESDYGTLKKEIYDSQDHNDNNDARVHT